MNDKVKLTREGVERLRHELEREQARLAEATFTLQDTMSSADNYDSTAVEWLKVEKGTLEHHVDELERTLSTAEVVEAPDGGDGVAIGSYVRLREETSGREVEVQLVSGLEATVLDPDEDPASRVTRASDDSPLGQRLLGRRTGEAFNVDRGGTELRYRVLSVGRR